MLTLFLLPSGALLPGQPCTRAVALRSAAAAVVVTGLHPSAHSLPPPVEPTAPTAPTVVYTPPAINEHSTPQQIALAKHLRDKGAKFYGAYWCSFCRRQRSMFGAEGTKALPYVECAADGYGGQQCPPQVTGYPAWELDGKLYGGMRTLRDLQAISGFDPSVQFAEYVPPPLPPRPPPPPGGFKPPAVEAKSTVEQLALAKHLRDTGAKFYGAYWCKYCGLQRSMFGAEGATALPYVECAVDGYQSASAECRLVMRLRGRCQRL
jgi:thiol-disulfide isomerase/thioredoxin